MFKIFSFGFSDIFNFNNIEKMNKVMHSFLDNIDINQFTENYEETGEVNEGDFIEFKKYEDMYLLTIDLKGIDIRELSIRYDLGILEISLNRLELEKGSFYRPYGNALVKKSYSKKFKNIEEIDTSQILKSIDNGILSIRMQKKYAFLEHIIDVDSYEDNVDN